MDVLVMVVYLHPRLAMRRPDWLSYTVLGYARADPPSLHHMYMCLTQVAPSSLYLSTIILLTMAHPAPIKVLVIGAGIGGLGTAIDLTQKGHAVTVYEASRARIPGVGAGIATNPNSARILDHLGIWEAYLLKAGTAEFPRFQRRYNGELISHRGAGASTAIYGYP